MDDQDKPKTDWPPQESGYAYIEEGKPGQPSYITALASGALATVHRFTTEKELLEDSIRYYTFTLRSHSDALDNPACGKIGWASSLLYHLTGFDEYLENAVKASARLCRTILDDLILHIEDIYSYYSKQPPAFTFEVAFEYAYWLTEILKEIETAKREWI